MARTTKMAHKNKSLSTESPLLKGCAGQQSNNGNHFIVSVQGVDVMELEMLSRALYPINNWTPAVTVWAVVAWQNKTCKMLLL